MLEKVGRIKSLTTDVPTNCVSLDNNYAARNDYARTIVSKNIIIIICVLE